MKTGVKIAISGKGGVGKTTVCAIWAQLFAEDGFDVIAIDADPDTNLSNAFGVPTDRTPKPLIRMKDLIAERTGTDKGAIGAYFTLNPKVADLPDKYCLELKPPSHETKNPLPQYSLKLLVLGDVTHAGTGCACPEGAFLKALLTHTILQRKEVVLVDLAAGVEFMGRASVQGIDAMVVVIEPGSRSIETAESIIQMAKDMGVKQIVGIINKITTQPQIKAIKSQLKDLTILTAIDYSPEIQQADLDRQNIYKAGTLLVDELKEAKTALNNLLQAEV